MSRHEGVSCDSCLNNNFKGKRYKCLICYDYDLCSSCYEAGATTARHTTEHPMQCILTRADFDLYYGGETPNLLEQPMSYTCPYCNKMGFTEATLLEHVSAEHADISIEVVCPVCASLQGGDPNLMTDDFAGHLSLEHRSGPRDLMSFLDEPVGVGRHSVRRIPHAARGVHSATRSRRTNMHFSSSGGLSSLSPSSRDSVDPIAELLSQLSGVRRPTSNTSVPSSTPSQLQQLQMQLQLERQHNAARQQLERLPRRQIQTVSGGSTQTLSTVVRDASNLSTPASSNPSSSTTTTAAGILLNNVPQQVPTQQQSASQNQNYLLASLLEEISLESGDEQKHLDRSLFVQQLLTGTLMFPKDNNSSKDKLVKLEEKRKGFGRLNSFIKRTSIKLNSSSEQPLSSSIFAMFPNDKSLLNEKLDSESLSLEETSGRNVASNHSTSDVGENIR